MAILMAGHAWSRAIAHGQSHTGHSILDRDLLHHYSTHRFVHALFNQLDLHNEFHHPVSEINPQSDPID